MQENAPSRKILLVDDDENFRKGTRRLLREFQQDLRFDVFEAASGTEAMEALGREQADCVLLDFRMPGGTGLEWLKKMTATYANLAVIMVTGYGNEMIAVEAMKNGAMDYLVKEAISQESLYRAIKSAIERIELRLTIESQRRQLSEVECERRENEKQAMESRLREQQIIQRERMNALSQMAGGFVHDFSNALLPILAHADYFLSHPEKLKDKEDLISALQDIATGGRGARDLVRRLRQFYKPQGDTEFSPVNINTTIAGAIQLAKSKWLEKTGAMDDAINVDITQNKIPLVQGAELELREAFMNLLLNAMDAIREREKRAVESGMDGLKADDNRITIETCHVGHTVEIRVNDTGAGMSAETQQRCFEPFFSTKGEDVAGLGLAMVHGVIDRHNGTISIRSKLEQGTEFVIRLPIYPTLMATTQPVIVSSGEELKP